MGGLIGDKIAVASALKHHSDDVNAKCDDIEIIPNDDANTNKRSHAFDPCIGYESCGLLALRSETSSLHGFRGSAATESLAESVFDTSKIMSSGRDDNHAARHTMRGTSRFTDATSLYHASSYAVPPALSSFTKSKERDLASLLSVIQALPREDLLIILEAATSAVSMPLDTKCGAPLHTCTDYWSSIPPLVMT
jgi:hypothetical protein